METMFNFSNKDTEFIYSLHPKSKIILHIKRKNNSSAILFFTNQINNDIDIPSEFFIYHNNQVLKPTHKYSYTLYWNKNYDVVYNGETLYNIRKEKTWTIYN